MLAGAAVEVTPAEFEILHALAASSGWCSPGGNCSTGCTAPPIFVTERTIDAHVMNSSAARSSPIRASQPGC